MKDDWQIEMEGGTKEDIEEYAKFNGADLTKEDFEEMQNCDCCGLKLDTDKLPCYVYCDNGGTYIGSSGSCSDCYDKLIKLYKKSSVKFRKGKNYANL